MGAGGEDSRSLGNGSKARQGILDLTQQGSRFVREHTGKAMTPDKPQFLLQRRYPQARWERSMGQGSLPGAVDHV